MSNAARDRGDCVSETVRAGDRDRYFASLFAPSAVRGALLSLHAYDLALAEVLRTASEPHIGLIRLAWWRDAVSALHERPVAGQPVIAALAATGQDAPALAALAESYMDRIDGDDSTDCGGLLFSIAARLLGSDSNEDVRAAGRYWAAANRLRGGGVADPPDLPHVRFAPTLRPITALGSASRRDFAGKREPRGALGRQFAMLRHALTGRT